MSSVFARLARCFLSHSADQGELDTVCVDTDLVFLHLYRCITILQNVNRREFFNTDYLVTFLEDIIESEEQMARDCSQDSVLVLG